MNDDLILENMPLVYHIIQKDYPHYVKDEDIVQCGMLGLIRSARNFDSSKGKFANYARKFIHGEIKRELSRRKCDHLNVSLDQLISKKDDVNW